MYSSAQAFGRSFSLGAIEGVFTSAICTLQHSFFCLKTNSHHCAMPIVGKDECVGTSTKEAMDKNYEKNNLFATF